MPATPPRSPITSANCSRSASIRFRAAVTRTLSGRLSTARATSETVPSVPSRSRRCTTPTVSSSSPAVTTGARVCPDSASSARACATGMSAFSRNTAVRGTTTSRSGRSWISNAPVMMVRCSAVRPPWLVISCRSSSKVSSSRPRCGSPPSRRTTTSVALPSNHTMGPVIVARALSGEATNPAQRRECCIARRLGASSPTTKVDAVTTTVTMAIPAGCAAPPRNWSWAVSGSASVTAAVAEARKPARVIPS